MTLQAPAIDRSTAVFDTVEDKSQVRVELTLQFSGPTTLFSVRPASITPPTAYGSYGGYRQNHDFKLIEWFPLGTGPDAVKEAFRTLLDQIEEAFAVMLKEAAQHNQTAANQVDRIIDKRREELGGIDNLRDGLSGGL